jgi:hypothetical protein
MPFFFFLINFPDVTIFVESISLPRDIFVKGGRKSERLNEQARDLYPSTQTDEHTDRQAHTWPTARVSGKRLFSSKHPHPVAHWFCVRHCVTCRTIPPSVKSISTPLKLDLGERVQQVKQSVERSEANKASKAVKQVKAEQNYKESRV